MSVGLKLQVLYGPQALEATEAVWAEVEFDGSLDMIDQLQRTGWGGQWEPLYAEAPIPVQVLPESHPGVYGRDGRLRSACESGIGEGSHRLTYVFAGELCKFQLQVDSESRLLQAFQVYLKALPADTPIVLVWF